MIRAIPVGLSLLAYAALAAFAVSALIGPALASHGSFTLSTGIYRVPYADGLSVSANNDHHNHPNAVDRVDLGGGNGNDIVAAASGIIRAVRDMNGNDFGLGDGLNAQGDPISTTHTDDAEQSCLDNTTVEGRCSWYNNYVWIEHPNGEWSKYTHFETLSVTNNGWQVGDIILAGEVLGTEGDVGSASGTHLHHEITFPPASATPPLFSTLGGFMPNSWNRVAQVCFVDGDDNGDGLYTDGEVYTAGPCVNTAPTADAGGPYEVDEGSSIQLDGTGSSDPHNALLSFSWSPSTNLTGADTATPTFDAATLDDGDFNITLTVNDAGGDVSEASALEDDDVVTITVLNVAPDVTAIGDSIDENGWATVSATFTDPGTQDTHTAAINWGDNSATETVDVADLASGISHYYGDNHGAQAGYNVIVIVTDDDGGVGVGVTGVDVANVDPVLTLEAGEVSFPGGDFAVVNAGASMTIDAYGWDTGSDDLIFNWIWGEVNPYYNDGIGPDPNVSSLGVIPFSATDSVDHATADVGVDYIELMLLDDDDGVDSAGANVIVLGNDDTTHDGGWWKHQFSGDGSPHIDPALADAYLEIVSAVSSVFGPLTAEQADTILAPSKGDSLGKAKSELLQAWLHFVSGAVALEADVPLGAGDTIPFIDLMFDAEDVINDVGATKNALKNVQLDLAKVRQAG